MKIQLLKILYLISILFLGSCKLFCPENDKFADDVLPRIAFLRTNAPYELEYESDLWIMDRNGNNETQLTFDLVVYDFNFSPNGEKICFRANDSDIPNIYVVNSDGSDLIKLTDDDKYYRLPLFTPDGSKLIFSVDIDDYNLDIMTMDINGNNKTNISNSTDNWELLGDISPDGSKIVYISNHPNDNGTSAMFIMDLNGENKYCLTSNYHDTIISFPRSPQFSWDGQEVIFINHNGLGISKIDVNGDNYTKLYEVPNFEYIWGFNISSDGNSLNFYTPSRLSQEDTIIPAESFEINFDGSGLINLSDLYGVRSPFVYSHDNTLIAYATYDPISGIPQVFQRERDYLNKVILTKNGGHKPKFQP